MTELSTASATHTSSHAAEQPAVQGHSGHSAPPISSLGGSLALTDLRGAPVTSADLKGKWTLLFFGYSRCVSSCSVAIPAIVDAARRLNKDGIAARAVLIDIEMPAAAPVRLRNASAASASAHDHAGGHAGHGGGLATMQTLAGRFNGDLVVLTGSRRQLNDAIAAFRVNREHVPPRKGETGHSINHSSLIYFLAPDGTVAGYTQHDVQGRGMASAVQKLAASSS